MLLPSGMEKSPPVALQISPLLTLKLHYPWPVSKGFRSRIRKPQYIAKRPRSTSGPEAFFLGAMGMEASLLL
jgi:hypothetical protein